MLGLLLLSRFSCVRLCTTPRTAAHQAPPSLGFSRQDHWSGLPFPSPMHESEVAQSCPTLRDPMDCSLPGSSVHGIFQARVLEWGAIASPHARVIRTLLTVFPVLFIVSLWLYNRSFVRLNALHPVCTLPHPSSLSAVFSLYLWVCSCFVIFIHLFFRFHKFIHLCFLFCFIYSFVF